MKSSPSALLAACLCVTPLWLQGAATITILNGDPAGVGFNDATPAAPVGGNSGTTLGAQRLIAFQAAADKWGATLTSAVPITVLATWEPLNCDVNSAVLGASGALQLFRDLAGAPVGGHWFGQALANKLFGARLDNTTPDIRSRLNVNLGNADCLAGSPFYLGIDNNHGSSVDLVTVLTHEFAHGLGFQTFTNGATGALLAGFPCIWDDFLLDTSIGKTWTAMTEGERVASAVNSGHLVWNGANVVSAVPQVLAAGAPALRITAPAAVAGSYPVRTASFGPALNNPGVAAEVMPVLDTAPNLGLACSALSSVNKAGVNGKIALVDDGICGSTEKVKNAQFAGAVGVIVVDNVAGSPLAGLDGSDPAITIPSVRISTADGAALKARLANRTRTHSGMFAILGVNSAFRAGADTSNRILMYAPNPFQFGASISHFDSSPFPNQLMEPAINADLTHEVTIPYDLTFQLLRDIGWN